MSECSSLGDGQAFSCDRIASLELVYIRQSQPSIKADDISSLSCTNVHSISYQLYRIHFTSLVRWIPVGVKGNGVSLAVSPLEGGYGWAEWRNVQQLGDMEFPIRCTTFPSSLYEIPDREWENECGGLWLNNVRYVMRILGESWVIETTCFSCSSFACNAAFFTVFLLRLLLILLPLCMLSLPLWTFDELPPMLLMLASTIIFSEEAKRWWSLSLDRYLEIPALNTLTTPNVASLSHMVKVWS